MNLTINDFFQTSQQIGVRVTLDKNLQLKIGHARICCKLQTILQRIPVVNQLPQLRHQRIKNSEVKSALLLVVAQTYGVCAASTLSKLPNCWDPHRPLSSRKIDKILKTLDHLYQPLAHVEHLPKFITDDLFDTKSNVIKNPCHTRLLRNGQPAAITKRPEVSIRKAPFYAQLSKFLLARTENQKRYQEQLKNYLKFDQISNKTSRPSLNLPREQALALHGLMCSYQHLPLSQPNSHLPSDKPTTYGSSSRNNIKKFSNLPIARQLSIVGSAAASRAGYRHSVDPVTRKLLSIKGLNTNSSYYSAGLKDRLTAYDHCLKFKNHHIYSNLGLSAHFITRSGKSADGKVCKELSLVFGGFRSTPKLINRLRQVRAILINLTGWPVTAALYKEAAQLAAQSAIYAREHGFNTFTVSGHSLGGSLAEYAVARNPDLIDRAIVFQPFHVMGKHRKYLQSNPHTLQKITAVVVANDWITSPLVSRPLMGIRIIKLSPKRWEQMIHRKYVKRLFNEVLDNLYILAKRRN